MIWRAIARGTWVKGGPFMSNMNRRELLGYGLGAAGALAASPLMNHIAAAPAAAGPETSKPAADAPCDPAVRIVRAEGGARATRRRDRSGRRDQVAGRREDGDDQDQRDRRPDQAAGGT